MRRSIKVVVAGVGIALLATTAAAAAAAPGIRVQPANPHPRLRPAAAVDTATETKYTPIAPCRIVDTRLGGGRIASGTSRSFYALGTTGFGAQGGASCDIPYDATAVTGSIIAPNATGNGYLKVYAYGASQPTSSFLDYNKSITLSASGTIPVVNSTRNFTVFAYTSTQVVIDLTGYYIPPMWTEVASDGGYVAGSRTASLSHLGTGSYQVDYDRNVAGCSYQATSYYYGVTMETEPRSGDANGIYIAASDYNGSAVDTYFYLTVTC